MSSAPLIQRWLDRLRGGPAKDAAPGVPQAIPAPDAPARLALDEAAALEAAYPSEYPIARAVTDRVMGRLAGVDLSPLARRSPSLAGYDWHSYLRCSICRIVRMQRALSEQVPPGGRVLDLGSYFGNIALGARELGFAVDAIDSYREYGEALAPFVALQRESGIRVLDFADGSDITSICGVGSYDAVICAGVIEHIPHTPRELLASVRRVLKPGGVLILDTPNLGYLYKRLALLEGHSIFASIAQQFHTELPFEGHHREYTIDEVKWMLDAAGFDLLALETFNYSVFGQSELLGEHVTYYRAMQADPTLREVIFAVARRRPNG